MSFMSLIQLADNHKLSCPPLVFKLQASALPSNLKLLCVVSRSNAYSHYVFIIFCNTPCPSHLNVTQMPPLQRLGASEEDMDLEDRPSITGTTKGKRKRAEVQEEQPIRAQAGSKVLLVACFTTDADRFIFLPNLPNNMTVADCSVVAFSKSYVLKPQKLPFALSYLKNNDRFARVIPHKLYQQDETETDTLEENGMGDGSLPPALSRREPPKKPSGKNDEHLVYSCVVTLPDMVDKDGAILQASCKLKVGQKKQRVRTSNLQCDAIVHLTPGSPHRFQLWINVRARRGQTNQFPSSLPHSCTITEERPDQMRPACGASSACFRVRQVGQPGTLLHSHLLSCPKLTPTPLCKGRSATLHRRLQAGRFTVTRLGRVFARVARRGHVSHALRALTRFHHRVRQTSARLSPVVFSFHTHSSLVSLHRLRGDWTPTFDKENNCFTFPNGVHVSSHKPPLHCATLLDLFLPGGCRPCWQERLHALSRRETRWG